MLRKLQVKFVAIIMLLMTVLMIAIFCAVNIAMIKSGERQAIAIMRDIAKRDGSVPPKRSFDDEAFAENSFKPDRGMNPQVHFVIKLYNDDTAPELINNNVTDYTEEEILHIARLVEEKRERIGKSSGFRFIVEDRPYGTLIVLLDSSLEDSTNYRLVFTSLGIGLASLVIIFGIALYLSRWAIQPVKKAFESQRQFVADASHEMKTPLAVISTNADVLHGEIGDNKWLSFIKDEVLRMDKLVHNLLYLAKSDDGEARLNFAEFNLSEAVLSVCLPFESVVFENNRSLNIDVADDIRIVGDESNIKQVVAILLDNAVKHVSENGVIEISLKQNAGSNKRCLTVFNTGMGISPEEKERIFERFYRSDSSRDRKTGGYGLGLAIAKTVVEKHGGKIAVECEQGKWIRFSVYL